MTSSPVEANGRMEKHGYACPAPGAKRRRIILVILAVVAASVLSLVLRGVVRPWIHQYFDELERLARHDPAEAKRQLLVAIALIAAVNVSVAIAAGSYVSYLGWRTMKSERWPYPGMKIYRHYRILSGKAARRRGRLFIALGVTLAILGSALSWTVYDSMSRALARSRPDMHQAPRLSRA